MTYNVFGGTLNLAQSQSQSILWRPRPQMIISLFCVTMFVLNAKIMQHLGVNFGGIWRFELGFLFCFFSVFFA